MKNKILMLMIVGMFFISFASASLGEFKQGNCVRIETMLNTSAVTIGSLTYPDSSKTLGITTMTKDGLTFNYSFCDTSQIGLYTYNYNDSEGNVYVNDFKISGGDIAFFIIIGILFYLLTFYGIIIRNPWVSIVGCFGLLILGLYTSFNGIGLYKNDLTSAVSYITIAIGLGIGFEALREITNK
jgi:hypothetical protein